MDRISIMGSNGSGKSTLLTLLDGLIYLLHWENSMLLTVR